MNPRMRIVWAVLESAKDVNHQPTIAACRRLIRANSRGWRYHHDNGDWGHVLEVCRGLQRHSNRKDWEHVLEVYEEIVACNWPHQT